MKNDGAVRSENLDAKLEIGDRGCVGMLAIDEAKISPRIDRLRIDLRSRFIDSPYFLNLVWRNRG